MRKSVALLLKKTTIEFCKANNIEFTRYYRYVKRHYATLPAAEQTKLLEEMRQNYAPK